MLAAHPHAGSGAQTRIGARRQRRLQSFFDDAISIRPSGGHHAGQRCAILRSLCTAGQTASMCMNRSRRKFIAGWMRGAMAAHQCPGDGPILERSMSSLVPCRFTRRQRFAPSSPMPRLPRQCAAGIAAGKRVSRAGKGLLLPAPPLLSQCRRRADCVHDEIFGPVAASELSGDRTTLIRCRQRGTDRPSSPMVFSGDFNAPWQVCERLEYGMVGLNRGVVTRFPAGAVRRVKQLGAWAREGRA